MMALRTLGLTRAPTLAHQVLDKVLVLDKEDLMLALMLDLMQEAGQVLSRMQAEQHLDQVLALMQVPETQMPMPTITMVVLRAILRELLATPPSTTSWLVVLPRTPLQTP